MADSTEPEEFEVSTELKYNKPVRLSLHLIVKRHLPDEAAKWSQERIIAELNKIRRVRLDRENIGDIDSMELLSSNVTNLYLQCNQIKCIENLECLPNLQVLVLSQNKLTAVDGISHLQKLIFFDLSENDITNINLDSFPKSIVILNLKDNPCTLEDGHREDLQNTLPKLKQLNGMDLIDDEIDDNDDSDEEDDNESGNDNDEDIAARSINNRLHEDRGFASPGIDSTISARPPLESRYQQLPTIQTSIPDMATEMLMRSQNRLEETSMQHKRHIQEITNIKIKTKIRPLPTITRPS